MGSAYYLAGDDRATTTFERLLEVTEDTDQSKLVAYRAQALARIGKPEDATAAIEYALSRERTASILYAAAIVYSIINDQEKSREMAAESRAKGRSEAWFNIPWLEVD